ALNNPYPPFDGLVSFSSVVHHPTTPMTPTSWELYLNKGPTNPPPLPDARYTAYIDNVQAVSSPTSAWNGPADANWSNAGSWVGSPTPIPSGVDAIAIFGLGSFGNRTVTVDSPRTVGSLIFNTGSTYTLAGANAITL